MSTGTPSSPPAPGTPEGPDPDTRVRPWAGERPSLFGRPDRTSLLAVLAMGGVLLLAVVVPGLIVPPTADDPAPAAVVVALSITAAGALITVLIGALMMRLRHSSSWLLAAFVPSFAVFMLGVLLAVSLIGT